MSEMAKTMAFVGAAVIALVGAFATRPSYEEFDVQAEVGKLLNQFEVDDAKRLKIVTFDAETAETREFEVAEDNGLWTIPSKQGYPADAVRQMASAATCLIDRELLRVAAESAAQHAELGLVDPSSGNLSVDSQGVGTRVTMTDIDGETLADMIIGKQVLDTDDQYYVRNADQDYAYTVNLDPKPLTTQFEDWIEKDLLKLSAMDVTKVNIKDYSAELMLTLQGMGVSWDRRSTIEVSYDDENSKWVADSLLVYDADQKEMVPAPLGEDEQLDEDKLRDLRYALDDLTIVDVERKPEGLSGNLKAGKEFLDNPEAVQSLMGRGFAPLTSESGEAEILSSEGEVICTLKDGVEYILRFGKVQLDTDEAGNESAEADPNAESGEGIHRYLFLMAQFNESMLEAPKLQELPELPEGAEEEAAETEESETDESETNEESVEGEESTDDEAEDTAEGEEATSDEDEASDDEAEDEAADKADSELSQLIAEREAIEKENQRLLKEYQQKVDEAKEKVLELNERFGDWYYVIDNKVYKNLSLGREEIVKAKEQEEAEGDAADEPAADEGAVPGIPALPGS